MSQQIALQFPRTTFKQTGHISVGLVQGQGRTSNAAVRSELESDLICTTLSSRHLK